MRLQDLHTHSVFDDGSAALEEMVCAAIDKDLSAIGLSGHSPIPGEDWTIPPSILQDFLHEAKRLKEKYRDQIAVYCGIEFDLRSQLDLSEYDYVIGSLHATVTPEGAFDTDNTAELAQEGIDRFFGGDTDAAAAAYFAQYRAIAENPEIDIVGHFDLLTKFNEQGRLYDDFSPRYLDAAHAAMRLLVNAGKIFEINSGAMSRGYRSAPYPAKHLLENLHALGGRICLNSDAHSTKGVGYAFGECLELAENCGFSELWMLTERGFMPIPISDIEW